MGTALTGRAPTVADVLALPVLAAGRPEVVTGATRLDRPVRWVHITEVTDPASFLKGGELVLTTGMPLPQGPAGVRRYVDELADVSAAALVIELVRRFHRPPDTLVQACRTRRPRHPARHRSPDDPAPLPGRGRQQDDRRAPGRPVPRDRLPAASQHRAAARL
ncbi:PucR family transcriptional regulator ligand-binding domain-containing protein [Streptomyces sp. Qhu-G9]|nr:PucR family transcriptional regulator ligand-binding domain-containing protein [Streptomyces aurantiacus]WAU86443.1 PucR family transcriptional regulator ligand-binding domain-containing protein [Streptomyces aurantiacus]